MSKFPPGYVPAPFEKTEWPFEKNQLEEQQTFFPRSITFEDIDKGMMKWFSDGKISIEGKDVPVFYLTPEKWAEFKHTWSYSDGNHNIKFPYITIRRSLAPKLGERGRVFPGKTFTTYRLPYYDNGTVTHKLYKVPQPIRVDLEYEIRCLTHYVSDINIINEALLRHFASLQSYLEIPDKHYMPMKIEGISDESDFEDLEDERVIHTLYSIVVQGYIINEDEFEEKLGIGSLKTTITEELS